MIPKHFRNGTWGALVVAMGLTLAAGCSSPTSGLLEQGNDAFERGDFQRATRVYQRAAVEEPDIPQPYYNAGNALYRERRTENAVDHLSQALKGSDERLLADANFSLGNAYFQEAEYEAAVEAYRQSLRIDPWADDAKHNLELALARLDEQRQQEEQAGAASQEAEPNQDSPQNQEEQEDQIAGDAEGDQQLQDSEVDQDEPLTEEQALRLLEALAQEADTLGQQLERRDMSANPSGGPEQDW